MEMLFETPERRERLELNAAIEAFKARGGEIRKVQATPSPDLTMRDVIGQGWKENKQRMDARQKSAGNKGGEASHQRALTKREIVLKAYRADPCKETIERLSDELGVSFEGVRRYLKNTGLLHRRPRKTEPDSFDRELSAFYREGWSIGQTARAFGVSETRVSNALDFCGAGRHPNPRHPPKAGQTPPDMRSAAE